MLNPENHFEMDKVHNTEQMILKAALKKYPHAEINFNRQDKIITAQLITGDIINLTQNHLN